MQRHSPRGVSSGSCIGQLHRNGATLGQARRKQVGRQEHSELKPKARQTPPLELLARSMRGRVPALIKLKYELMAESPFGYFRGAVPVMAADLSVLPSTGIVCQLCGDAHVRNLGAYAAPDGRLVFDINDFDETIRGPFEWDLKRMAASSWCWPGAHPATKKPPPARPWKSLLSRYAAQMRAFARMTEPRSGPLPGAPHWARSSPSTRR